MTTLRLTELKPNFRKAWCETCFSGCRSGNSWRYSPRFQWRSGLAGRWFCCWRFRAGFGSSSEIVPTCSLTAACPSRCCSHSARWLTSKLPPTSACRCWHVFITTGWSAFSLASAFSGFCCAPAASRCSASASMPSALVVIVAILTAFFILGFNLTTLLAGLGIGGIAIAFAAQKTLENLFGGISVLGDEVIHVGDYCRFGDRTGTVEDISLRSTRIRTDARTEVSIPNGALATMNIENFTRRDKILFNPALGIRFETTADQLRYLLAEVRRMLYAHPKVESDTAYIRLASFDSGALRLEIFSYVLTRDAVEFAAIREDLLLRIMDIVEKSGSGFAFPSQTVYFSRDSGLDKEKATAAEQQVQQWRDQHLLPFPDFAPADKSAFRGSIVYPPAESATGRNPRLP